MPARPFGELAKSSKIIDNRGLTEGMETRLVADGDRLRTITI
jgi:hypothetical protein